MILLNVIEIKLLTMRNRVKHIIRTEGVIAAIKYHRNNSKHPHLQRSKEYVEKVGASIGLRVNGQWNWDEIGKEA